MRGRLSSLLLVGAMITSTAPLAAQAAPGRGALDVAVTYGFMLSNVITSNSFWMQGGSAQVEGLFYHGLSAVADVGGMHTGNINSSGVGLDMVTVTFGPRYTWTPAHRKYALFGQSLMGVAKGFNSIFPATAGALSSSHSLALVLGGGMNVALTRRVALRAFEADWVRTQLPNSTNNAQNNLRIGAGIVFRFR